MSVEIYFAIASFITFAIFVLALLRSRAQAAVPEEEEKPAAPVRRPVPVAPRDVRGRVRRRAPQRQQRQNEVEAQERGLDTDESSDDDGLIEDVDPFDAKMGAKKRKKLEEKAAKKQAREAELREREDRKQREEKREEERKKQEEKEKALEKKQEELEKKRKEEQEKKEQEEYEAMKAAFSVEEEGYEEKEDEDDEQNQLQKFISHIKAAKVVVLEDMASLFRMKTQDVIDRITALQEEGSLTGVIDDRGKFIFIHEEELKAVAKFIRQRGRVSITELADASNSFINLTPDESHLLPTEA